MAQRIESSFRAVWQVGLILSVRPDAFTVRLAFGHPVDDPGSLADSNQALSESASGDGCRAQATNGPMATENGQLAQNGWPARSSIATRLRLESEPDSDSISTRTRLGGSSEVARTEIRHWDGRASDTPEYWIGRGTDYIRLECDLVKDSI